VNEAKSNPLSRFERQRVDYPLIAAAVVLFAVMLAGLVFAVRAGALLPAILFIAAPAVFVILILVYFAKERRRAAVDDRKFIHWDAAMPELQRQNVNVEVRELAKQLQLDDDQLGDLLSAYVVAEDLALRQIQQEENLPLMRHVSIGRTTFDGILADQDLITCIEVSFLVTPDIRQEKIESMLKKAAQAKKNLAEMKSRLRLRLMLVLVTQLSPEEEEALRAMLVTRRFSETPVDIDIRMLDFEMLQKVYLSE
jgi:hypothetical protein